MNPHPSYFRQVNDQRVRVCPYCQRRFVRTEDAKGHRDHCKHVDGCRKRNGR